MRLSGGVLVAVAACASGVAGQLPSYQNSPKEGDGNQLKEWANNAPKPSEAVSQVAELQNSKVKATAAGKPTPAREGEFQLLEELASEIFGDRAGSNKLSDPEEQATKGAQDGQQGGKQYGYGGASSDGSYSQKSNPFSGNNQDQKSNDKGQPQSSKSTFPTLHTSSIIQDNPTSSSKSTVFTQKSSVTQDKATSDTEPARPQLRNNGLAELPDDFEAWYEAIPQKVRLTPVADILHGQPGLPRVPASVRAFLNRLSPSSRNVPLYSVYHHYPVLPFGKSFISLMSY